MLLCQVPDCRIETCGRRWTASFLMEDGRFRTDIEVFSPSPQDLSSVSEKRFPVSTEEGEELDC